MKICGERMFKVLKVDASGTPQEWLSPERAAALMVAGDVAWTTGQTITRLWGGTNQAGKQSFLDIPAVLGGRGSSKIHLAGCVPYLGRHCNTKLFERDRYLCAYCGVRFERQALTRDHVMPVSRGGQDEWTNVVTACGRCNRRKDARTPDEAHMPLLYVPYQPNWYEDFILQMGGRVILADQMDFLAAQLPKHSRVRAQ